MLSTIIILLILGIVAIGLEFLLPGGILGVIGVVVIAVAVVLCFSSFGPGAGLALAGGAIVFVLVTLMLWLKYFSRTGVGKKFLLQESVKIDHSQDRLAALVGQEGVAKSDLRPVGKGLFGEERFDVVAEAGTIDSNTPIKVIKVDGTRIVVRSSVIATV